MRGVCGGAPEEVGPRSAGTAAAHASSRTTRRWTSSPERSAVWEVREGTDHVGWSTAKSTLVSEFHNARTPHGFYYFIKRSPVPQLKILWSPIARMRVPRRVLPLHEELTRKRCREQRREAHGRAPVQE